MKKLILSRFKGKLYQFKINKQKYLEIIPFEAKVSFIPELNKGKKK